MSAANDDPGRARLEQAAREGLITDADVESLDAWAGELARRQLAGELTQAEVTAAIYDRLAADIARRGQA